MVDWRADGVRIPRQIRRDAPHKGIRARDISPHTNVKLSWLDEQCRRTGLDLAGVCRRAFDRGPIAVFIREAEGIKQSHGRPYTLRGLGAQALKTPTDEAKAAQIMREIDDLRFFDPARAAARARKALRSVGGPGVTRIVGAMASSHLMMFRLDWAMVELGEAMILADVAERRDLVAELARRACGVLRDRGKLEAAAALIREALGLCEAQGNEASAAYCLVELAVTLLKQGRPKEARRRLEAAGALNMKIARYRYAVPHNLAFCHLAAGDLDAAEEAARQAEKRLPPGKSVSGFLAWLQACIAYKREDFPRAATLYAQAYDAITEPAADRLLIGAEWVRTRLAMGLVREAARTTEKLLTLHGTLETDSLDERRVLSMAAMDLVLAGRRAEISANLVDGVLAKIAKGRKARIARLRERLRP